ncbi:MAG: hypothetical protein JSS97_09940 [Actinobacteria bacterium]|nr:hypothetical protein [Actinomycetota bacterium]
MRAKAFAAVAAATVVAALSPAVGAATGAHPINRHPKPTYQTLRSSIDEIFYLHGTNGFAVVGKLRDRHELALTALSTRGKSISSTTYTLDAPQRHGSDGIEARLGRLGSIDVRFVAESTHHGKPLFPSCKGGRPTIEEGRFVGQIRFHGEDGYTDVDVHGAPGQVTTQPTLRCNLGAVKAELKKLLEELGGAGKNEKKEEKGAGEAEEAEPELHLVKLEAKVKDRQITFEASRVSARKPDKRARSFTSFSVKAERHRGRIDEVASASAAFEPGSAFTVPDITHLTQEGVVKPPAPFSGSATYRRESPHSLSWTGDLAVNLPGFGLVHLAGPKATATVCADAGCAS